MNTTEQLNTSLVFSTNQDESNRITSFLASLNFHNIQNNKNGYTCSCNRCEDGQIFISIFEPFNFRCGSCGYVGSLKEDFNFSTFDQIAVYSLLRSERNDYLRFLTKKSYIMNEQLLARILLHYSEFPENVIKQLFQNSHLPKNAKYEKFLLVLSANGLIDDFTTKEAVKKITLKAIELTEFAKFHAVDLLIDNYIKNKSIVLEKRENAFEVSDSAYIYENGRYALLTENDTLLVSDEIARYLTDQSNRLELNRLRKICKDELDVSIANCKVVNFEKYESRKLINFKNCLIKAVNYFDKKENILKTKITKLKHNKRFYSRFQLKIDFENISDDVDIRLIAPNFDKALIDWFGDDKQIRREVYKLLYYIISDPDRSEQIALFLRGEGGDGKGEFIKLCKALIPEDQISSVSLEALGGNDRHATSSLYNKRLNIVDETRQDNIINDAIFKQISGGSTIEANPKFKQSFSFQSKALFVILSNHPLKTVDTTRGMYRRLKGLFFNHIPKEKRVNNFFVSKLMPEISEIVYKIIYFGSRFWHLDNGLSYTKHDERIIDETANQNPIFAYWQDLLLFDSLEDFNKKIGIKIIKLNDNTLFLESIAHYENYKEFVKKTGNHPSNLNNFTKNSFNILERLLPKVFTNYENHKIERVRIKNRYEISQKSGVLCKFKGQPEIFIDTNQENYINSFYDLEEISSNIKLPFGSDFDDKE